MYAKPFFDLQWQFVDKIIAIAGLPLSDTLLEYTNLYIRFGCGRDFQSTHPIWQAYLAGLHNANNRGDWTYSFYLSCDEANAYPPVEATFGCFSYAQLLDNRIRLHFQNTQTAGYSSLSIVCIEQRIADLTALFSHVQRTLQKHVQVVGGSWLYNLDAYRRLFPPSYIATACVMENRFRGMSLWGQFLDRYGKLKEEMTRPFLERLKQQRCVDELHECFPFQVLVVEAPVQEFYDFYGL